MAIYSYVFSMYEKLASARLNALISAINAHNHDGGSGGVKISYTNLVDLSSVANIAGGIVVTNVLNQYPPLDGSLITNITIPSGLGVPTGSIFPYGGLTAPTGYLMCDGTDVLKSAYAALYVAIADRFGQTGAPPAIGYFRLPRFTNRFPYGASSGSNPGNASVGSENTTQLVLSGTGNSVRAQFSSGAGAGASPSAFSPYNTYDYMVPYLAVNYIIKT